MAQGPNQVTAIEATFNCGYESQSPVAPGNDHFRNIFATVLRAHARVILERVIYRMPTLLSEPGFPRGPLMAHAAYDRINKWLEVPHRGSQIARIKNGQKMNMRDIVDDVWKVSCCPGG